PSSDSCSNVSPTSTIYTLSLHDALPIYDFRSKEYAHPSGVVVATPDGRVAQYLLGVTCSAADLNAAIKRASARQISSPMRDLLLLCFHYTPITGKYGALVIGLVRATAVLT